MFGNKPKICSFCFIFCHLCFKIWQKHAKNLEKEDFDLSVQHPQAGRNIQQWPTPTVTHNIV